MKLTSVEAIYLRWISQGRSLAEIASIEQQPAEEIRQKLDAVCRRLGVTSIIEAVEKAKSTNII
ncbi:helix-turn-helix transcriptional regulator [Rhizobium leucaenae]|uniref:DNA-binding CsgD family transcriptional regulator n=1 Tax=Rhizobium leucaenae TaxID=29450 RepID=A0A7W6ZYD2_9HYPH|nr:LuxR C-terminal-related transcriptional regulator [Rhizobium leucaenae]MBB4571042.1 DNA-binding CsgD family transcriptional regulator [Rhizobium leucaenae]